MKISFQMAVTSLVGLVIFGLLRKPAEGAATAWSFLKERRSSRLSEADLIGKSRDS